MINQRRSYKKSLLKRYKKLDKMKFYDLSKTIKEELHVIRNKNCDKFASNFSKNPISSRKMCQLVIVRFQSVGKW
jgi:hypothetical protein